MRARPLPSSMHLFPPPCSVMLTWLELGLAVSIRLVFLPVVRLTVTDTAPCLLGPGDLMAGKPLLTMVRLGMSPMPAKLNPPSDLGIRCMFELRSGAQTTPTLRRPPMSLGDSDSLRIPPKQTLLNPLLRTATPRGPPFSRTTPMLATPVILVTTPPLRGLAIRVLLA